MKEDAETFHVCDINTKHFADGVSKEYGADAVIPGAHDDALL